ncbi:Helix-turn-helix family protein [Vibrio owensii]|uniref:Helix-turn-helix family protein n=1 Tax=Vibrio owensii TaxID=696485 RepID=A0AAU9QCC5_9VIBR|nr:Helix-turn-helix family protein [Vibrio owensii]
MFGEIIKEIRKKNSLTQKDLALKLANASEEFRQLDLVTISRWERGMTSPNNAKAVRVLRSLNEDVILYLQFLAQSQSVSSRSLDEFVYERFHSNILQSTLAAFNLNVPQEDEVIEHDKVFLQVNDKMLTKIRDYHRHYNQDRLELFKLDLYLYQEENKLHGYRFHYASDPETILGYSMAFFFSQEELENQIKDNGCNIDFKKSTSYKRSQPMSMLLASGIVTSSALFRYNWTQQIKFLARHSNITHFYANVLIESMVPFLTSIGFEIVSTQNQVEKGGIKIGRRRYERCLMKIDTSVLLTSKEALSLVQRSF